MLTIQQKQSLDNYLTTEPNNGFNEWCEMVFDNPIFTEHWEMMEVTNFIDCEKVDKWLDVLHVKGYTEKQAAKVVLRGFKAVLEAYVCEWCNEKECTC